MAPFRPPKSTKILQKSDPKRHQYFDRVLLRFFVDFDSVLGAMLVTFFEPRRPKTPQGRPQDAPNAPKTPKDTPRRPKTPPRRPQGAQNPPQTTILEGFWTPFRRFWEDFWKTFGLTLFRTPWAILLFCYFSFWRGGGFAALLRCWIIL